MNSVTNSNNKRPAPCDETWANLSDDAQRRWRQNRNAQRKFRKQGADASEQFQDMPRPFRRLPPAPVQHDGQVRVEAMTVPASTGQTVLNTVEVSLSPRMAAPVPPSASSPSSTVDLNSKMKSPADELLHLLEFPTHAQMASPSQQEMATPSFHLPRASDELSERAMSADAQVRAPTNELTNTPTAAKLGAGDNEGEGSNGGQLRAPSRIDTASPSPPSDVISPDILQQDLRQPQEDEASYLLSPLSSLVSSSHSNNSKSSLNDMVSNSTHASTPTGSPDQFVKSPTLGGLNIKLPEGSTVDNINSSDRGETALHKAAASGHEMIVRLLLEGGADAELPNHAGRRALHMAAESGHLRVVNLLVDAGADVEACDYTGSRPLHLAASGGHGEVARFLLWKGAHVNALERPGLDSN